MIRKLTAAVILTGALAAMPGAAVAQTLEPDGGSGDVAPAETVCAAEFGADLIASEAAYDEALACVRAQLVALEQALAEIQPWTEPQVDLAAEAARTDERIAAAVAATDDLLASLSWPEGTGDDSTGPTDQGPTALEAGGNLLYTVLDGAPPGPAVVATAEEPLPPAVTAKQIEAINTLIALNQAQIDDANASAHLLLLERVRRTQECERVERNRDRARNALTQLQGSDIARSLVDPVVIVVNWIYDADRLRSRRAEFAAVVARMNTVIEQSDARITELTERIDYVNRLANERFRLASRLHQENERLRARLPVVPEDPGKPRMPEAPAAPQE